MFSVQSYSCTIDLALCFCYLIIYILWQDLPNLKRLNLSNSSKLIRIPDLSRSPNIEEIILSHCGKLEVVYSSKFLDKLKYLWLNGCDQLWNLNLPSSILSRSSGLIILCNCHSLEKCLIGNLSFSCSYRRRGTEYAVPECLSQNIGPSWMEDLFSDSWQPIVSAEIYEEPRDNIDHIDFLYFPLSREGSFPTFSELCLLDLSNCESLTSLPVDLSQMKFLKRLVSVVAQIWKVSLKSTRLWKI